tara:strand:- start:9384 stop:10310 length:927 start_codon:yes stop_codon:yes gene_type:complete
MKIFKPKFWDKNYHTFLSVILFPVSLVYQLIVFLKKKISAKKNFPIPIICIGNIYIGGTGKTPLAIKTFEILKELNKNPVIIKKDYANHKDEILLLKNYSNILVSKNRVDAINEAIKKAFDCVILDDGYQDFQIKKNLNIVCFHKNQKIGNGQTLPSGPLRESLRSLRDSQIVLLNGIKDMEFENKLKKYNPGLKFFYYSYLTKNIENFKNKKLIAFAGIGNPNNFFDFLKINHLNLIKEVSYPDHYEYSEKELDSLSEMEKQHKAKLITTEKDYFRINPLFRKRVSYIPIKVKLEDKDFKDTIKKFI